MMGLLLRERGWTSAVELVGCQRDALSTKNLPVKAKYQWSQRACLLASNRTLGAGEEAIEQWLWRTRFQELFVVRHEE